MKWLDAWLSTLCRTYRTVHAQQMLPFFIGNFLINIVTILCVLHSTMATASSSWYSLPFLFPQSHFLSLQALAPGCKLLTTLSSSSQVTEKILRCTGELRCTPPTGKKQPAFPDAEVLWQEETWLYRPLGICRFRIDTNYHPLWIPWKPIATTTTTKWRKIKFLNCSSKPYCRVKTKIDQRYIQTGHQKRNPTGRKKWELAVGTSQKWQQLSTLVFSNDRPIHKC